MTDISYPCGGTLTINTEKLLDIIHLANNAAHQMGERRVMTAREETQKRRLLETCGALIDFLDPGCEDPDSEKPHGTILLSTPQKD